MTNNFFFKASSLAVTICSTQAVELKEQPTELTLAEHGIPTVPQPAIYPRGAKANFQQYLKRSRARQVRPRKRVNCSGAQLTVIPVNTDQLQAMVPANEYFATPQFIGTVDTYNKA